MSIDYLEQLKKSTTYHKFMAVYNKYKAVLDDGIQNPRLDISKALVENVMEYQIAITALEVALKMVDKLHSGHGSPENDEYIEFMKYYFKDRDNEIQKLQKELEALLGDLLPMFKMMATFVNKKNSKDVH